MPEPIHYSLQVIRVQDVLRGANGPGLYVEIKLNGNPRKAITLNDDGCPLGNDTITFSLRDPSDLLNISLKRPRAEIPARRIGDAKIDIAGLLGDSAETEVQQTLDSRIRSTFLKKSPGPASAGTIHLRLRVVTALERARIDTTLAEQLAGRVGTSTDQAESTVDMVGSVIEVVDEIMAIVDTAAEIHPLFDLSWRVTSALYRVTSHQYETDRNFVDMVDKMKGAFDFAKAVEGLDDTGVQALKPKVRELLQEAISCARFAQRYACRNFFGRMGLIRSRQRIHDYAERFKALREEVTQLIMVNTNVKVHNIDSKEQLRDLKELLGLPQSDGSDMSQRARCLEGTRQEYLEQIEAFLSSDTSPNVLWLSGAAGSGKSTIALTAVDKLRGKGCQAVYLFFERGKSNASSIVRTLAYQLALLHPPIGREIIKAVDGDKMIKDSAFRRQFEVLLLNPLRAAALGTIFFILDALDECGTVDQRRDLLQLLGADFPKLPNTRCIVTSRPEDDIMRVLSLNRCIHHVELDHSSNESRREIELYFREKMKDIFGRPVLEDPEWDDRFRRLADATDGLFIWATTAVRMVESPPNQRKKLRTLLVDVQSSGAPGIDGLYSTALEKSGISWDDPKWKVMFTKILGLILVSKEELSDDVIAALLGLDEDDVDHILNCLHPVIYHGLGQPVRLRHASFADYITSDKRCGDKAWCIDEGRQKQAVAECCFEVMRGNLRFNICNIDSSFLRNKDIPDRQKRIASHLVYACRYWAVHLCELSHSDVPTGLLDKLHAFLTSQFPYWLEVLSLTGHYNRAAGRSLFNATLWMSSTNTEISALLWASYRLASVFAYPISQSAPQIYLSAMSLWKDESGIAKAYSRNHPLINVQQLGRMPPAQCIRVLKGHTNMVRSIGFSSDGRRVVSGSWDNTIRVWDADNGALVSNPFKGHTGAVTSVGFSPDGRRVVSGSHDMTIRVWDADSGALVSRPFEGHTSYVTSVGFSPDGRRVVSGSCDLTIRVWDADSGALISGPFEGHASYVTSVGFSPDGRRVVSGSHDKTIRVWDAESGALISGPFEGHTNSVTSAGFSPDGRRIASGSWDNTIRVWDADSGALVSSPFEGHAREVTSIAFSPDGRRVVSGSCDLTIRVWDADSGALVSAPLKGHSDWVRSVGFSPDGRRVVSGSDDSTIRMWDANSGALVPGPFEGHTHWIRSVGFSPDGRRVVSGSDDNMIRVWDAISGALVSGPFEGHTSYVASVGFSPDGQRVVSGSCDNTIRVWDADSGALVLGPFEGHTGTVTSVGFSPDGRHIVSGSDDNTIRVWDAGSGALVSGPFKGHTYGVRSVGFSPDGRRVVSGSVDSTIRVWDADSGALVSGPFHGHIGEVTSVGFSPDGRRVASGAWDNTIRVWDAESGALVSGPFEGHTFGVSSVGFSPDGRRVVSGSYDRTIRVWDAGSGVLVSGPFEGHTSYVTSVAFSPDGQRVVSGSFDNTIRVWDTSDNLAHVRDDPMGSSNRSGIEQALEPSNLVKPEVRTPLYRPGSLLNWTLSRDGWVLGEDGELLTWVPVDMRTSLWRPRNTVVFSSPFLQKFDFLNSPVGPGWSEGFSSTE